MMTCQARRPPTKLRPGVANGGKASGGCDLHKCDLLPRLQESCQTIVATINALSTGIATQGRITEDDIGRLLSFTAATSGGAAAGLESSDPFWTADIVDAALAGN